MSRPPQERATSQKRLSSKESSDAPAKAKPKAEQKDIKPPAASSSSAAASSSTAADAKAEVKPEVKTEGTKTNVRAKSLEPKPKAKAKAKAGAKSDDEVEITGIKPSNNTDIEFWKQQSNKELINQLTLRYNVTFKKNWAFKSREQTIEIIEELIKNNQWVIEDTTKNKENFDLVFGKDRNYWKSLTIPQLKEQLMIRGLRYTGAKVKKDYLNILYNTLGI